MAHLAARDSRLAAAIARIGPIRRKIYPDAFCGIAHAITGQQVSARAHAAIWQRFARLFDPVDPAAIAATPDSEIRACGISQRKISYIRAISAAFASGKLDHDKLAWLSDDEFRKTLTGYPGIGRWTCDMVLIFTFQRENVLSYEDLAIRRGMCLLYGYEKIIPALFQKHFTDYSPYATLAGMYLWEIAGLGSDW